MDHHVISDESEQHFLSFLYPALPFPLLDECDTAASHFLPNVAYGSASSYVFRLNSGYQAAKPLRTTSPGPAL